MMHHSLINSTFFMIQIYWTNNFTERTILLNKRFNWMIVQFENEQNRWKMNYNSENHLIIFLSEQLKKNMNKGIFSQFFAEGSGNVYFPCTTFWVSGLTSRLCNFFYEFRLWVWTFIFHFKNAKTKFSL